MSEILNTRPYRPSNGTEGDFFQDRFCSRCEKDKREDRPCRILSASFIYDIEEKGYPKEWLEDDVPWDQDSKPRCTAFVERCSGPRSEPLTIIRDKRQIGLPL